MPARPVLDAVGRVTLRSYGDPSAGKPAIVYDCASAMARCQLRVTPGQPWPNVVRMDADRESPLSLDDVEIFPVRGSRE